MNTLQESPSGGSERSGERTVAGVPSLFSRAKSAIRSLFSGQVDPVDHIHPDFAIPWKIDEKLTWYFNREWGPADEPVLKIGCYFNDPSLLDACPWVAKIARNLDEAKPGYAYFCILFGDPNRRREDFGFEDMKKWAARFDESRVMSYA